MLKNKVRICEMAHGSIGWYLVHFLTDLKKEVNFFLTDKPEDSDIIIVSSKRKVKKGFLKGKIYLFCNNNLEFNQLSPNGDNGLRPNEKLADLIKRLESQSPV